MTYINSIKGYTCETVNEQRYYRDAEKQIAFLRAENPETRYYLSQTPCANWSEENAA